MCGCEMPFSGTHLNILDLCRLCLGKDNSLIPVFDNSLTGNQLCNKISVCLAVEIKNEDEVSQKICNPCLTKVNSFFEFRSSTLECQKVLQRWVSEGNQTKKAALSVKDAKKGENEKLSTEIDKSSETTEFNKTKETNEPKETRETEGSEIDNDSRRDSESTNSEKNDEEHVTQELIRFYKSLASDVNTSTSNADTLASDIVLPESEVPGPSGLQQSKQKSSPLSELKARFRHHNFEDSKGQTQYKEKSVKNSSTSDQDSKQNRTHLASCEGVANKEYSKKNLECNLCQFTARYKSQLDIHLKRHKKDYKIFCDVCHKGFFYQYEILMHKALHEETNRFQCNVCKKKFVYRHSLISHTRKHTDAFKPLETFQCDKCGKKFSNRSYLKRHIDVHMGVNRVVCEVCGQVLCSPVALRSHSLTHTGERPFSCAVCGKSFTSNKYMIIHKRMHTGVKPFKCQVCEKSFSQQSTLIVHNRYHSGERPYKCQVCFKAFVTKTILKVHLKSHTA